MYTRNRQCYSSLHTETQAEHITHKAARIQVLYSAKLYFRGQSQLCDLCFCGYVRPEHLLTQIIVTSIVEKLGLNFLFVCESCSGKCDFCVAKVKR